MSIVLPGKPSSKLQALACGCWRNYHINAYITGAAFTVIDGSKSTIQTIYDESDDELESIAIDDATGKISVGTISVVRIYKPSSSPDDPLKWALEYTIDIPHSSSTGCSLSWGRDEELLVANQYLSLFSLKSEPQHIWEKSLPSESKTASISYDSAYIVSLSAADRVPKVWRRLAYGNDGVRFDFTYLPHPNVVTSVKWRKPVHIDQANNNILYTFCIDGIVRVWIPTDTSDGLHWLQWGTINVNSAFLKDIPTSHTWVIGILDGRDFTAAVESAVQHRMNDDHTTDDIAMDHLVAIANKTPEICIAFSTSGLMAIWALENVCPETATRPKVLDVSRIESKSFETLLGFFRTSQPEHTEVHTYYDKDAGRISILLHEFDGRIGVISGDIAELINPISTDSALVLDKIWTGHSDSITKIVRNFGGSAIVSRTENKECTVWKHVHGDKGGAKRGLDQLSNIAMNDSILKISVLRKGRFVVLLGQKYLSLWDCRMQNAVLVHQIEYSISGIPLCLIVLPRPQVSDSLTAHLAMVTTGGCGLAWRISLPSYGAMAASMEAGIVEFCSFTLPINEPLASVLPVDPAGTSPVVSGFLDVFARDVAVSYTKNGRIDFWTAQVDTDKGRVDWLSTSYTDTGMVDPALASGSTLKKAALVNSTRSQLTIWDIGGSRLEFQEDYTNSNSIQDLDWTSTPDSQSILSVGFQYKVILLSQMRFDYLNRGPAWAQIREINIRDLTPHPVGDSVWLGDGHLVTGVGNQLFIHDRKMTSSDATMTDLRLPQKRDGAWDLFDAVQRFNGPLALFHPQFLSQCILAGKATLVRNILTALSRTLRYLIPGEGVDDYLGLDPSDVYLPDAPVERHGAGVGAFTTNSYDAAETGYDSFSEQTSTSIHEHLTKLRIPQLSGHEQIQLMDIVECVALVDKHRRSIDENGSRFMLFFRQHALRKGRTSQIHLSWREINWAYHSNSQDILLDFVIRQSHKSMKWEDARESGIFMWLSDSGAVKAQFEAIARNEYTDGDTRDPVGCSLFYLALRKKNVLQGLWRMAMGNKEQAATQRLLANDFDDPKWKRVALKNAYALLSKRRFREYFIPSIQAVC
ncbi:hypothetical protein VHEMI04463 [[Torrubiella] hemipterigena]|uniref:RAVE complex protein Rav1 C-terminal domain-containing protein n=1 Tax=[Torrubiella] hemipterigena TaxID=1531966 RepID=A0A0A1TED0_9HYPO|nr:hypothetical protein VHEMI04463 [[Torrubiella] hemipterigena]